MCYRFWKIKKSDDISAFRVVAIEDLLDGGLPTGYDKPLYEQKCAALFEHFYENYTDASAGTYAAAG